MMADKTDRGNTAKKISSRGGRPSREQAKQIEGRILDAAADLFFAQGYGTTSIEMVAKHAHISKRTFYDRYRDKAEIFRAVVHRLIQTLRTQSASNLFEGPNCADILEKVALAMVHAALLPQALALHRLVLAEAMRFPELALVMNEQGARREAVRHIAALLDKEVRARHLTVADTHFAAEQFIQMVISVPQRRALGLGKPMNAHELEGWAQQSVALFLRGCGLVKK
jgi:TetR/AcrR family transcriptional repressor of mexJK operon